MNIFILDLDHEKNAQCHCDKHVVKMVLETTQLLSNALIKNGASAPYKLTHKNHPCSIWTSQSRENFVWLTDLGMHLCKEYSFRYNKIHKCQSHIEDMYKKQDLLPSIGLTDFAVCMPDNLKIPNDVVASYRNYYKNSKATLAKWKNRNIPEFML